MCRLTSLAFLLLFGTTCLRFSCGAAVKTDFSPAEYNNLFQSRALDDSKDKVETLGAVLKRHVQELRETVNKQVDLIFLVDSSASVGRQNFLDELKFVRKLLADFTVDYDHTRVAVITFSSRHKVIRQVDYLTSPTESQQKCSLLEQDIPKIKYVGGGTYTLGAVLEAKVSIIRTICIAMLPTHMQYVVCVLPTILGYSIVSIRCNGPMSL
jgi:hypothetical protein